MVATSLLGFQAAIDKNLLGEQGALLLVGQIDSDLIIIGERIRNGLAMDAVAYPFTTAMSDLAKYASSMSVVSALVSMQRAGAANAQKVKDAQAEEALLTIRARTAQLSAQEAKAKAEEAAQLEKAAASRKAADEMRR